MGWNFTVSALLFGGDGTDWLLLRHFTLVLGDRGCGGHDAVVVIIIYYILISYYMLGLEFMSSW